jgi:predicted rRNA methylase YqxC with S4 and FtsJ domains
MDFMENQFIYFVVVKGNKDLLKKEIQEFYPYLTPSFSKGDFLTYKNTKEAMSKSEVERLPIIFALEWGINSGDLSQEYIDEKLKAQEYESAPDQAPSRAYLKIAQACEKFEIQPDKNLNWIEFGSAPGGASYYLLQNFGKVVGVDPGDMDEICLKDNNFTHLKVPIQNLNKKDFPKLKYDWVASDLNLNPNQSIREVVRLASEFKDVQGIFMTVKIVKPEHIEIINKFKKKFRQAGFKKIKNVQLPAHRREFLMFAYKPH